MKLYAMHNECKRCSTNNVGQGAQLLPTWNVHSKSIRFYGGALDTPMLIRQVFHEFKDKMLHFAKNISIHSPI